MSPSVNPGLNADFAHFITAFVTLSIFHLLDRQTEYISRIDYNWKQQLLKKQKDTEFTKETNQILVENILPIHVADIYLNRELKDKLYYEKYDNVAVMFATICNYTDSDAIQNNILQILNQIICDFDQKLLSQTAMTKIEKIKVAGWTYMVACGLDPGRSNSSCTLPGGLSHRNSLGANGRRSLNTTVSTISSGRSSNTSVVDITTNGKSTTPTPSSTKSQRSLSNVVCILTRFALELMKTLKETAEENSNTDASLRIGISHGEVMAGVIGSSKPLYDIWGNAVNMASRMDSTGIPGKIQVTENTANVLGNFGIDCDYRGQTFVKGTGNIPTYLVCVEDFEFQKTNDNDDSCTHF